MASEILEDLKLEPNGEEDNEEVIEQESRDVPEKELSGETKEETEEKKSVEESKEEEPKNSEKPKRGRKKSLKSDSSGGKRQKLDHESGEKKEPTTPARERPTKERKTVERYSAPSLARSSSSKGLSIENGRGTQLKGIPNGYTKAAPLKPSHQNGNSSSSPREAIMDPPPPASEQSPTPYPFQWPAEMPFTPSSMQAAQAAAFATFFQQHLLAQQPPTPILSSAGVGNPESVFDSFTNSQPPSSQLPLNSEYQPPSTQNSRHSTQGINRKAPNWKVNEDVALCESWIRVSEDPIVRIGQAQDAFWLSIWHEFKERVPGTERVQRACENRWSVIQGDVSKWRAIVRRVHRNRASGTIPNDEWGTCFVVFKKDNGRDFKFIHCWEVLHYCAKWQISTDEKEARDASKGGRAGTSRARSPNPPFRMPSFTISGSSSPGIDSFDDSCPDPDIDIPTTDTPTSGTPYNHAENTPPPNLHPNPPVQRPLGRKSTKEKCRRTGSGVSESYSAPSEQLNATISAWRHSSESRFDSLKLTAEELAFLAMKNARLDSLQKSIKITKELAKAEKELLLLDPNLSAEQVLTKRYVRMRELEELDKEHKEIRALEYSPGGSGGRRLNKEGV